MEGGEAVRLVKELAETAEELGRISPKVGGQFNVFLRHAFEEGALSAKVKRLIALAAGIVRGCDWCIATHVKKAIEAGATKDEIIEACFMAIVMGGGPALAYTKVAMDAMKGLS
ncbi:MAG: carboxymuconolactone decarboxylase family protein [Candidatus Hodarchaeaceae archaeon]|nr:carboxymuconolactone decarboxylase family protein [Candidatus Hodarchaeaceae archaeon]